ncbi:MAG: ABC transporter permease, partial [Muribaculaceae bacterium]|nr:ABC transporter permease [Muribaculaceae bacterium]
PMLSGVSVIGTALAIFLIMVVVMLEEVKVAPFAPESNRERILYADYGSIYSLNDGPDWNSNGGMSEATAKKLYKDLKSAEAVSLYVAWISSVSASLPGQPAVTVDMRECDDDFFNVFDFTFIDGKPFSKSDFESGIKKAVITKSLARKVFGDIDVVGKEIRLSRVPYVVSGVVKDVSTLATTAYADAWIPYTTMQTAKERWNTHMGAMSAVILAKEGGIDEVKEECGVLFNKFNEEIESTGWKMIDRGRPYTQEEKSVGAGANQEPDVASKRREHIILLAILLLVPAINLSSMTHSRLRQRRSEIGVKRAFGATRGSIVSDILTENMVVTLLAGVIGFALSVVFAYLFSNDLFSRGFVTLANEPKIDLSILIHVSTFMWVLLFCFLLNVISTGIPAWQASRVNVVNAIKG